MGFAEAFVEGEVTFTSPVFHLTLFLDFKPFRLTPLDFQLAWNLDERLDYCSSLSWSREVLDIALGVRTNVYECSTGIVGFLEEETLKDCIWNEYEPRLKLY